MCLWRAQQALSIKSSDEELCGDSFELEEVITPEGKQIEVLASGRGGNWIGNFVGQIFY